MPERVTQKVTPQPTTPPKVPGRGVKASVSIRPRTDGSDAIRVTFRDNGRQRVVTVDTAKDATKLVRELAAYGPTTALGLLEAREQTADATPTVSNFVLHHILQTRRADLITEGTARGYRDMVAFDLDASGLGGMPVSKVTREMVRAWVDDYLIGERHLANQTIRKRTGLLFAAMARAVEERWITANPAAGIKIGKYTHTEMTFVEPREFQILLDNMDSYYHPLFLTLYGTGLRIGEATALRVRDLDLDAATPMLRVSQAWAYKEGGGKQLQRPKSERSRRAIGLPPQIVAVLRPLIAGKLPTDLVFVNRQGRWFQQSSLWTNPWQHASAALEAVTGKRPRMHDLRHSHASNMIAAGADLLTLQKRLGHASIKTTIDRYGHLGNDAQGLAAAAAGLSLPLTMADHVAAAEAASSFMREAFPLRIVPNA